MPGSDDVLATARQGFEDAHSHLDGDLAATTTAAQARAVQDNHDAALAHYLEALRTAFECSDADWAEALSNARQAQADVDAARAAAQSLPQRLNVMAALTSAVGRLIDVAR